MKLIEGMKELIVALKPISAGTVLVMCIELIYNLTHNHDFNKVFTALKYIMIEIPFLIFLLFSFLAIFVFQTHFTLGF